jgi:hypothetical protein
MESIVILSAFKQSIVIPRAPMLRVCFHERHDAECRSAEFHYTDCRGTNIEQNSQISHRHNT